MTDGYPATLGVVLAGGLARRMGADKPLQTIAGRTLLDRVIARLKPQCDALILNANGDPTRFAASGLPVVADTVEGFAGPLAGVLAALEWTAAHRPAIEWVISAPVDCPFLPRELATRLHTARREQDVQIALAASTGRVHPVVALWSVSLRDELRNALVSEGVRKVDQWSARYTRATATWTTEPFDPFFNVNTPQDLAAAESLATLDDALDASVLPSAVIHALPS